MKTQDIALVIKDPSAIKGIKTPSFDVCMAAVMQDGTTIKHVDAFAFTLKQYGNICKAAVRQTPKAIAAIQREKLTGMTWDGILSAAVEHNADALRYINEQTPKLCLKAVGKYPKAIKYVDKAMCDSVNPHCYQILQNTAQEAIGKAKKGNKKRARKKTGEKAETAAKKIDLRNATRQTESLCLGAVRQDGFQLRYVWRQTRKICLAAMRQNPEAYSYVRDSDMVRMDDILGNTCEGMGGFASAIGDYVFYGLAKKAKKIPAMLKIKGDKPSQSEYLGRCHEAINDNICNIKFVNPAMLSDKQYREFCVAAIIKQEAVLRYIGEAKITGKAYLDICLQALVAVSPFRLGYICQEINIGLLSAEQYRRFVEKMVSVDLEWSLRHIDAKKLKKEHYFAICQKVLAKDPHELKNVNARLLTKAQYSALCFKAVRKNHYVFDHIDTSRIGGNEWHEFCKIAVQKSSALLYGIDVSSKARFQELFAIALRNGGGLRCVEKQDYRQCMAVIRKNGWELCEVRPEQFSVKQYFALCTAAIKNEPRTLGMVDYGILSMEQYVELCGAAMRSLRVIDLIDHQKILERLYRLWCRQTMEENPHWIKDVQFSPQYYSLCLKAVKKEGTKVLKDVSQLRLSPEQYSAVREAAEKRQSREKKQADELDFLEMI